MRRSLETIIKGKRQEGNDDGVDLENQNELISQEVDKIQSISIGNYVDTPIGIYNTIFSFLICEELNLH